MTAWLRTNAIGFPIIVLMAALILVTITWPRREDNLGFREPTVTVPVGGSTDIDGAQWSLRLVEPDLSDHESTARLDDLPEGAATVAYLATMTGDLAPREYPTICSPVATDGTRRWGVTTPAGTRAWASAEGYSTFCRLNKSFVSAFEVPTDADIIAVDLLLLPSAEGDAAAAQSRGRVIRFLVD